MPAYCRNINESHFIFLVDQQELFVNKLCFASLKCQPFHTAKRLTANGIIYCHKIVKWLGGVDVSEFSLLHILFPVSAKNRRIIVSLIEQNIIFISFQISPGSAVHYAHYLDRIRDTKSGDSPQCLHRKVTNTLLEII